MSSEKSEDENVPTVPIGSAIRALKLEYKSLQEEPVEGFRVKLVNESNVFEWEVVIFGPPDTLYEGGYFKARMRFPSNYPYCPPMLRFISKFWHPNVFASGGLCISILQTRRENDYYETEKWSPAQNVRTVLLSVISLLNEPNTESPANVEACNMYKLWRSSKGLFNDYEKLVREQVEATKVDAETDGVVVPTTVQEYCKLGQSYKETLKKRENAEIIETLDYYVDQGDDESDDEEDES